MSNTRRVTLPPLVVAAILAAGVSAARAEEVLDLSGKDFSERDIIGALEGSPSDGEPASRSFVPKSSAPRKLSMNQITFEKGSDQITKRSLSYLDVLGRALGSDTLKGKPFLIEGHTDATGSMEFNMRLSKRRAESVKRYLVEAHHLDARHLLTIGKGPTDLLDKATPQSEKNRRVVLSPTAPKPAE